MIKQLIDLFKPFIQFNREKIIHNEECWKFKLVVNSIKYKGYQYKILFSRNKDNNYHEFIVCPQMFPISLLAINNGKRRVEDLISLMKRRSCYYGDYYE